MGPAREAAGQEGAPQGGRVLGVRRREAGAQRSGTGDGRGTAVARRPAHGPRGSERGLRLSLSDVRRHRRILSREIILKVAT